MVWIIAILSVLLVAVLARVFLVSARAIRRDMDHRFQQIQSSLEEEANAVVEELASERDHS
jgi:hypothetical protein